MNGVSDYRIKRLETPTMHGFILRRRAGRIVSAFLLAMTIGHIAMVFNLAHALKNGYQDFTIFYTAGTLVRSGQSSLLYDAEAQYRTERDFAPDVRIRQAALPYIHTPFEALFFVPFTFLGYVPAYSLWTVLNIALIVLNLVLLRRNFEEIQSVSPALLGLAATGFFPVAIGLIQGQDTILVLLSIVLATVYLKKGRNGWGGAALGLGLFKFHFIGPLALILAVRRPRLLLGFMPVAGALGSICIWMVGWQGVVHYIQYVLNLERSGAGGAIMASDMPNIRGLVDTLAGLRTDTWWSMFCTVGVSVVVMWATMAMVKSGGESVQHTFALATVAAILVSYHALPYDLVLLFPSVLVLLSRATSGRKDLGDTVLVILLFLTPLYVLLWLRWNQFAWFGLLLIWLLWRLGRSSSARQISFAEAT